jgi:hypothetical protein
VNRSHTCIFVGQDGVSANRERRGRRVKGRGRVVVRRRASMIGGMDLIEFVEDRTSCPMRVARRGRGKEGRRAEGGAGRSAIAIGRCNGNVTLMRRREGIERSGDGGVIILLLFGEGRRGIGSARHESDAVGGDHSTVI